MSYDVKDDERHVYSLDTGLCLYCHDDKGWLTGNYLKPCPALLDGKWVTVPRTPAPVFNTTPTAVSFTGKGKIYYPDGTTADISANNTTFHYACEHNFVPHITSDGSALSICTRCAKTEYQNFPSGAASIPASVQGSPYGPYW